MKLIKPSYKILTDLNEVPKIIERAGRCCYKSEEKIKDGSADPFCKMLIGRGHESVIEHAYMMVKFTIDRGCCYDAETEVLTDAGWKKFTEVDLNSKFACLNEEEELEWHHPEKLHSYYYDGDLLAFENSSIDLLVTPNHQMWIYDYEKRSKGTRCWKFIQASDMRNGRYGMIKTAKWSGAETVLSVPQHPTKYKQYPELKFNLSQTDDLLELLGMWITSYRYGKKSGSCLQISQTKSLGRNRIDHLCSQLGIGVHWYKCEARIDNIRLVKYVESVFGIGAKTFTAHVPKWIKELNSRQISRFLDGVVLGDGNVHKQNKHIVVYTASKQFADDLQELWMKVGLSANIRTIQPRYRGEINGKAVNSTSITYVVSVHGEKRSFPFLVRKCSRKFATPMQYKGYVYCATVPYHRLYVRRNGKPIWCGNSHEMVRHRLCNYSQESTRFCNYSPTGKVGEMVFIIPPWLDIPEGEYMSGEVYDDIPNLYNDDVRTWFTSMQQAESNYNHLISSGWKAEQARSVLPNSLKTELIMTANMREWRHIFKLRTAEAAHPQMREIMTPLLEECKTALPCIFESV